MCVQIGDVVSKTQQSAIKKKKDTSENNQDNMTLTKSLNMKTKV